MDQDAPSNLVKYAESVFHGIDYVVLNHLLSYDFGAWIGTEKNFTTMERSFAVNFNAYVRIASLAIPHLEKSRGGIIVMSSIFGKAPAAFATPYTTVKHALQVSQSKLLSLPPTSAAVKVTKMVLPVCVGL